MAPPVAIAVVSWNLRDLLGACLRSLAAEVEAGRAEVWVVDNGSDDGSPQMVEREFPWASLVALEENVGYGRAVNLVAERTESEWVAPANADIELEPGALEVLLETGTAHPEAGALAPRLVLPDRSTQHSVWAFPTVWFTVLLNLGVWRLNRRLAERLCFPGYWDEGLGREVPWAVAAFLLVRRMAFDAVGGFDPEQWMHAEDLDLGWRLSKAGWRTRYEPRAVVRHVGSAATGRVFGEDLTRRFMAASYSWMARRRGLGITWTTAGINVLGTLVRLALVTPLALVAPKRWQRKRDTLRQWAAAHRTGLRSRSALLEPH